MAIRNSGGIALAAAIGLLTSGGIALAQTAPVPAPPPVDTTTPQVSPSPPTAPAAPSNSTPQFQAAPAAEEAIPACPAGEFASKFSDVSPSDWAYDAVNRLAIGEYRCFPGTPRS